MSEQAFITLLNCVVRDLNRNGKSTRGYVKQEWRDIWFTSHTFRRAGAQYRFMFAVPERRWSLRMVKWWAGWTPNESAETLGRYLLDQATNDEDKQLADCLVPDREAHSGCPTTYSGRKRNLAIPVRQPPSAGAIEKRLKIVENSVKVLHHKINLLVSVLQPSQQSIPVPASANSSESHVEQVSILPPAKDWKDMYRMYWNADPTRHLFKPVSEWTVQDKKKSGALPSRLSVAKLIAEDVKDFATQKRIRIPRNLCDISLASYAAYYTDNWLQNAASSDVNVLTIDTLARYIRLDRKRRLVKSRHAYLRD